MACTPHDGVIVQSLLSFTQKPFANTSHRIERSSRESRIVRYATQDMFCPFRFAGDIFMESTSLAYGVFRMSCSDGGGSGSVLSPFVVIQPPSSPVPLARSLVTARAIVIVCWLLSTEELKHGGNRIS